MAGTSEPSLLVEVFLRRPDLQEQTSQRDPERTTVLVVYAVAEMQQQGRALAPPADLLKLLRSAGDPPACRSSNCWPSAPVDP